MKKNFFLIILLIFPFLLFAGINSIEIIPVGNDGDPVEANSINNPVFHLRINADAQGDTLNYLSVKNIMNNPYGLTPAKEPDEIVAGSVKLWYFPYNTVNFDDGTAQYVTHLAVAGSGDYWSNTLNLPVGNNYDIWVTVDIQPSPAISRTLEFQSNGISFTASTGINSFDEPFPAPFLMTTDITPGDKLEIFHQDKTVSQQVALSEENFVTMEISFFNASGDNSADILINSITITVKDSSNGSIIAPNSIISYIAIADKDYGDIYGSCNSSQIPNNASPIFIPMNNYEISVPANTTVTVNVKVNITNTASAIGKTFVLSLENSNDINAYDFYTLKKANKFSSSFDSFPMTHNAITIISEPDHIDSWYKDIMPVNVYKGMVNIPMINLAFENPGNTSTASVLIKNINVRFLNTARNPVMPKLVFSKVSLTNETGTITFDSKVSAQLSAIENIITFNIPQGIEISGGAKITLTVKADLLADTQVDSFFISTLNFPQDIVAYVAGTTKTVNINSLLPLPYESSVAILASSFKVSCNPKMPGNIFAGQENISLIDINFSSPVVASGSNTILAKGITFTARDSDGNLINFSDVFSILYLNTPSGTMGINAPESSSIYFDFPQAITITGNGVSISLIGDIKYDIKANSIQVLLSNASDINAYVNYNPSQKVFIMPETGYSFPMSSGTGVISGDTANISFTNYPNPFKAGDKTRFSYFLVNECEVTIAVYDITGRLIRTIINKELKSKGAHSEDFWDGKDNNGKYVLSGTYLVKIDACGKKEIRKVTLIK